MPQHRLEQHPVFSTGLFWFTNDLRVHDNAALKAAAEQSQHLVLLYVVDPSWFKPTHFTTHAIGHTRWQFLLQTLRDLQASLNDRNQSLRIIFDEPVSALSRCIAEYNPNAIFRSVNAGYYEKQHWDTLRQRYRIIEFTEHHTHTLFAKENLPFTATPSSYSKFRKLVEPLSARASPHDIEQLPPMPNGVRQQNQWDTLPNVPRHENQKLFENSEGRYTFEGGESAALAHLESYFSTFAHAAKYKETRNELRGWNNSTKFSPWLANGSLSVNTVLQRLQEFEQTVVKNESTYWISFELLWREYFQWLAHDIGAKLYKAAGIGQGQALQNCRTGCFYPERYQRWCHGNTPYAIVNAAMKELNTTGYMSNRARQCVASCFVNELGLDWRYGAAYFEKMLIDYDVASNWGNWQYLAGVGVDPRASGPSSKRHFDLEKQMRQYDPKGDYIRQWRGEPTSDVLDSVDAADWPIG